MIKAIGIRLNPTFEIALTLNSVMVFVLNVRISCILIWTFMVKIKVNDDYPNRNNWKH